MAHIAHIDQFLAKREGNKTGNSEGCFGKRDANDGDGIPDLLEEDVGMDPANPDDAFEDMDGDGFANFVEYDVHNVTWASDPNDVDSKPHVTAKLRLFKKRAIRHPFHCIPVVVGGEEKFKVTGPDG